LEIKTDIKNKDAEIVDVKDKLLFPLLIDCHVHFREPGLEHKATILTEAASAIAGGIGCVCEMPNTLPPTVTVAAFADKVRRATEVDGCTLKFFFGVTEAIHLQALRDQC
jgi:dihydroorotase